MPSIVATTWMSADGRSLMEDVPAPFGRMVTKLATKEEALGALAGGGPELMFNTFVTPNKPIANARSATTSVLKLRTKQGEMPDLPNAGAQGVQRGEDGKSATLHVNIHDNQPASGEDAANKEYLEASGAIDSADKMVIALAKRATDGAGTDAMARAEAMRKFVHEYISGKSLDTAFATASEVARMKAGDCSEHGVLLCAMLRADGIPARVAGGLVYADQFAGTENIFGWHMWTQALIDGKWVDFDGTLPVRYDAVHVLTTADSMAENSLSDAMSAMIQLIGNLEIEVVEIGYEVPSPVGAD
jgi:transglutaminase-like putative cysteine protease